MILGITLGISSAFIFSVYFILLKFAVNKASNFTVLASLMQIISGLMFLPIILFEGVKSKFSVSIFLLLGAMVLAYSLGSIFRTISYKGIDVSINTLLQRISLIVSFAGAIIVIGEPFKINRFVGVLMILMGILILFVKTGNHKNIQQKMLLFAIISPIGYGLGQLFDGMNSMNFSPAFYAGLGTFLPGVVLVIFAFFRKITIKDFVGELRQNWLMILLMSLANTIGYYLLIVTYEFIDKSLAIPLLNLNAAFSVILGMIILKERRNMLRKIIATLVILAAVILLARA